MSNLTLEYGRVIRLVKNGTGLVEDEHYHPNWVKYSLEVNSTLIVCVNLYVLILIGRKRCHLRSVCNIFLSALLVSHLGIGIVGLFMFNVNTEAKDSLFNHMDPYQWTTLCMYQFFSLSTVCMIVLVTVDRLIAIKRPYFYNELTWKFCISSTSIIMAFPIGFIISEMNSKKHIYNLLLFCKALASIVLAISHHLIYREVKRQFHRISKLIVCENLILVAQKKSKLHQRKIKSTRTCYFIVLSNIVFWLPCSITFILILTAKEEVYWSDTILQLRYAAHVFENLNSLKDPLMYAILNKDLRCQLRLDRNSLIRMGRFSQKNKRFEDTVIISEDVRVVEE